MRYISEANTLLTASSDGKVCFIDVVTRQSNKLEVSKTFSGHSKSKLGTILHMVAFMFESVQSLILAESLGLQV